MVSNKNIYNDILTKIFPKYLLSLSLKLLINFIENKSISVISNFINSNSHIFSNKITKGLNISTFNDSSSSYSYIITSTHHNSKTLKKVKEF